MPSLTLESGVEFFYTDSGAVANADYITLVIIHGHTFHSGTFRRLHPFAQPNSLRIISVNRREYPGSSPYTDEDLRVFGEGSEAERASLLGRQGRDLALFVDGLIRDLSIPKAGGIALVGWSLGTIFLFCLIACIETLPVETKERLSCFVHTVILLQPPSLALGLPTPEGWLIPHTDPNISPEARGPAFAKWVSSYFIHGDLSTRSLDHLTYSNTDPRKSPTTDSLEPEDYFAIADFAPAEKYDSIVGLPPFEPLVFNQMAKALFDSGVRAAWSGAKFWNVYGNAEPWNIIYAAWFLEDRSRAADALAINFKIIEGGNHFIAWEEPGQVIKALKECLPISLNNP
ncbi:Alpha/Beta hydrolase protein [Mycena sp. CBHHK59/15]|nr:Alpha/Beta hydrolase protein [Mycena sp. CBHHK59/15]